MNIYVDYYLEVILQLNYSIVLCHKKKKSSWKYSIRMLKFKDIVSLKYLHIIVTNSLGIMVYNSNYRIIENSLRNYKIQYKSNCCWIVNIEFQSIKLIIAVIHKTCFMFNMFRPEVPSTENLNVYIVLFI